MCKTDFKTLSAYVKHQHDLHNHNKHIKLICSCGGSFSTLRSLQAHWSHFHKSEELHEDIENDKTERREATVEKDYEYEDNASEEHAEDDTFNSSSTNKDLSQEEQMKMFEKRILYMVLTLQTVYYTSEAAAEFVVSSLMELFLVVSTNKLTTTNKKEIKTAKYAYVPFIQSLKNYLELPEVQADINRVLPAYDRNCIQDTHDGMFARYHSNFSSSTYLKIELNSDNLTVTNPISHRAHSIFFFYWLLLNVARERRSRQPAKRLVDACLKWARKYGSLYHTMDDFLMGMHELSTTGITISINDTDVTYYGGLFLSLGDYSAQMSLNGFKETVSATHFCHLCDIQHNNLEADIDYDFQSTATDEYKRRCDDLDLAGDCNQSFDYLSKKYGMNNRSLFDEVYDVIRQCPFDVMHTLLEGVLPNHLNAFLDFCSTAGYFTMDQFCREVNRFPYDESELNSKSHLDLASADLKKQNNLGMPLTSMQTFYLFINLPFVLKNLLHSSDFPQYQASLICVDTLSLCFSNTISITTPDLLRSCIKKHNDLFRRLYPERKHQFFKGNKVRNLKNPSLMLARRHELWLCVNDHCQDGSLSHAALVDGPNGVVDNRESISDARVQFIIANLPTLPFKPMSMLKVFNSSGYKYSKYSIVNLSKEHFPVMPIVGKIKWIFYDGKNCAFICNLEHIYKGPLRLAMMDLSDVSDFSTEQIKRKVTSPVDADDEVAIKIGQLYLEIDNKSQADLNEKLQEIKLLEKKHTLLKYNMTF
ncbi:unnamed protein product [Rotaria magnacalcarata]